MSEEAGTTTPNVEVVAADDSPQSPCGSDQTVVISQVDEAVRQDNMLPQPGSRVAIFSTELGTRSKLSVSGPAPPVIVRSGDKHRNVWDSAHYWRMKYPKISFAIFPDPKWTIEDLWDDEDIHIETRAHLQNVLEFIKKDNAISAGLHAQRWAHANFEQWDGYMKMNSLEAIADPSDPLGIVDRLFVNGEIEDWPRAFLWHTTQAMRTTLIPQLAQATMQTASASLPAPSADQPLGTTERSTAIVAQGDEGWHASSLSTQTGVPTSNAPQPSIGVPYHPHASLVPSTLPDHPVLRPSGNRRVPSQARPGPFQEQATQVKTSIGGSALPAPRGAPARPHAYNNPYSAGAYGENMPRSSMPATRGHSTHSPHFIPAVAALAQTGIPPHVPGYPPMSPSAQFAQPYHSNFEHPGLMPVDYTHPLNTSMQPVYIQQVSRARGSRGASIGEMANSQYYNNGMLPHNMDTHRPDRRSGTYTNNGNSLLYDPNNGASSAFNDHNTGRKSSRGGFTGQGGRPRKFSGLDQRPRNASYGSDRAEPIATHGGRPHDHRMVRPQHELDPYITGDPIRGCNQTWIGPENYNVNELFVSDIPQGVEPSEVQDMFMREVSIFPVHAVVKRYAGGGHHHAFVLFSTPAEAKLALRASEGRPKIRGVPVRITVPRRFYMKVDDLHNQIYPQQSSDRYTEGRDFSQVPHAPANEAQDVKASTDAQIVKPQYSPQDARSDLQKKTDQLSSNGDSIPGKSEVLREKQEEQLSPTETTAARSEQLAVNDASEDISATQNGPASNAKTIATEQDRFEQATAVSPWAVVGTDKDAASPAAPPPATRQSSQSEVVSLIEDILSQSLASQSAVTAGHSRSSSQTKEIFEDIAATADSSEVAATVNIPPPTEGTGDPAKQTSTMDEAVNPSVADHASASNQGTASDEDAGPDSSFLSAQEVVDTDESTAVPKAEIPIANLGTEPSDNEEPKRSMVDGSVLSASTKNTEVLQPSPLPENKETAPTPTTDQPATDQPKANAEKNSVPAKDTEANFATPAPPPVSVKDNETMPAATAPPPSVAAKDTKPETTAPAQSAVPVVKKPGPQQTPSLNPFAKPKKAKRKEKEQKKKATTVKTDKTASPSGANDAPSPTKQDSNVKPTDAITATAQISKATNNASPSTPGDTKDAKIKAAPKTDVRTESKATVASKDQRKEKNGGKQTGGKDTNIPNASGSVTHKTKVEQKATTAPAEGSSSASAPPSSAQSPRREAVPVPEQTAVLGTVVEGQSGKEKVAPEAPKGKKTVPAVPHLQLKATTSSTRTPNTQPDSATPSSNTATSANTQPPPNNMSQPAPEADAVSDTSSDTLHPSEPGQPSRSSAAENFYTPQQTPTIPDVPQEQTAPVEPEKKKRKKSKKKKKKAPTPDASVTDNDIESTNDVDYEADPFGNQMSHIDAIREDLKNPNSYYNSVNKRMAERDARIKSGQTEEGEDESMDFGPDPTQFRKLQAFFMENPNLVRSMQDRASE